jgi:DNA-binding transcriptional MerR regulator
MSASQLKQTVRGDDESTLPADNAVKMTVKNGRKAPSAFRTISEVAEELKVQQHVLRFWETKFSQVKPLKRGGGRRYYRPEDVALLRRIHHLLYTEGYTIKGVQKLMKGQGRQQAGTNDAGEKPAVAEAVALQPTAQEPATVHKVEAKPEASVEKVLSGKQKLILEAMLGELRELRTMIRGE